MAGLCAAVRARELGLAPTVLEKGDRAGDPKLQGAIVERLDDALDWLESLGAPVVSAQTANPLTVGRRFDPRGLTEALLRAAGDVSFGRSAVPGDVTGPLLLATGGFPVSLAREHGLALRANPWSAGDGLAHGVANGADTTPGMDEFYG